MEVILIRHTSVDVPPGVCYGQTDVPLKPTFEAEAAVTAENLKAYLPFDHVYTSPLTRCVRLATYCGYPDAERDKRIMEINFGDWEMKRSSRMKTHACRMVCRLHERGSYRWRIFYYAIPACQPVFGRIKEEALYARCHLRTWRRTHLRATLCRNPQSRRSLRRIDALRRHRPHQSRQGIVNEIVGPSSASVCTL